MSNYAFDQRKSTGSAIVMTLFFIAAISMIFLAFIQSIYLERNITRNHRNKVQANLLVDGAVQHAITRLWKNVTDGPFASIYFLGADGAPYLAFARFSIDDNKKPFIEYHSLFSTRIHDADISQSPERIDISSFRLMHRMANGEIVSKIFSRKEDIVVNINQPQMDQPFGMVGLRGADGEGMRIPVNWIYQISQEGKIVGRYAFWIDDESSKVDVRFAGNQKGFDGSHQRSHGYDVDEISLHLLSKWGLTPAQICNLFNYQQQYISQLDLDAILHPLPGADGAPLGEALELEQFQRLRPFLTCHSRYDDRAFDGKQKLSLNAVVKSTVSEVEIAKQVNAISNAIDDVLPSFGTRYYQSKGKEETTPSDLDQRIYRLKLAANIRDYVDEDSSATVLVRDDTHAKDFRAYTRCEPNFFPYEAMIDEVPICGKEKGPFLNEYARVIRVVAPDEQPESGQATITLRFAHYFELYNIGDTPIAYSDLGPNPRIILANRIPWENRSVGGTRLRPMDIELRLPTNFSIPPNGYAVLYTDGPPYKGSQEGLLPISAHASAYALLKGSGPGTWSLIDKSQKTLSEQESQYEDYVLKTEAIRDNRYNVQCVPLGLSYINCRERLLFVSDHGLIDMTMRLYTVNGLFVGRNERNPVIQNTFIADGATSIKNTYPAASDAAPRLTRGDPRSNTEISAIEDNTSACWKAGGAGSYGNSEEWVQLSLGAKNFGFNPDEKPVERKGWAEYSVDASNHVIRNGRMRSLGELGFIYDPGRYDNKGFRSYGRTLRVGQSDDAATNRISNSSKLENQRWLGGLGADSFADWKYGRNAFLLCDVFSLDEQKERGGRININGLVRSSEDLLLEALFDHFTFNAKGVDGASGVLTPNRVHLGNLSDQIRSEIKNQRAFLYLGDLSRLEVFSTTNPKKSITGKNDMSQLPDADKEEVFRRTVGLLNPHSLAFTIHVIAQSGIPVGNQFRPTATSSKSVIISFKPEYSEGVSVDIRAMPKRWFVECVTRAVR